MPPTLSPATAVPSAAVAGSSYGGGLASDLTGTSRAGRLVYAGSYPEPAQTRSADEPIGLPGLLFHDDMTAEFDTGWWPRGPTRSSAACGKPTAGR